MRVADCPREVWALFVEFGGCAARALPQLDQRRRAWLRGAVVAAQVYGPTQCAALRAHLAALLADDAVLAAHLELRRPSWLSVVAGGPPGPGLRILGLQLDLAYVDLVTEVRAHPIHHDDWTLHASCMRSMLAWVGQALGLRCLRLSMTRWCLGGPRFADLWAATLGTLPHLETFELQAMVACLDTDAIRRVPIVDGDGTSSLACARTLTGVSLDLALNALVPADVLHLIAALTPARPRRVHIDASSNAAGDWSALAAAVWTAPPLRAATHLSLRLRGAALRTLPAVPNDDEDGAPAWRSLRLDLADNHLDGDGVAPFFRSLGAVDPPYLCNLAVDMHNNRLDRPPDRLPTRLRSVALRMGNNPLHTVAPFVRALAGTAAHLGDVAFNRADRRHVRTTVGPRHFWSNHLRWPNPPVVDDLRGPMETFLDAAADAPLHALEFDLCLYPYALVRSVSLLALVTAAGPRVRRLSLGMDDPRFMDPRLLGRCVRLENLAVTLFAENPVAVGGGPSPAARFRRALRALPTLRRLMVNIKGVPSAAVLCGLGGAWLRHPRLESLHLSMSVELTREGVPALATLGDALARAHRLAEVRMDLYLMSPSPAPAPPVAVARRFGTAFAAPALNAQHLTLTWWSAAALTVMLREGLRRALGRRAAPLHLLTLELSRCALDFAVLDAIVDCVATGKVRRFRLRSTDTQLPSLTSVRPAAAAVRFHLFVRGLVRRRPGLDFVGVALHIPGDWKTEVDLGAAIDAAHADLDGAWTPHTLTVM